MNWTTATPYGYAGSLVVDGDVAHFRLELPSPFELTTGGRAPSLWTNPLHTLTRPFQKWIEDGTPEIGDIVYCAASFPGKPNQYIPFALSIAPHPPSLREPFLLPGTICLFPGYGWRGVSNPRRGTMALHHITIRESSSKEVHTYTHGRREGEKERTFTRVRLAESDRPDFIHLATTWIGTLDSVDQIGVAEVEVPTIRARKRPRLVGAFVNNGILLDNVTAPQEIMRVPNHLKSVFFLSTHPPADDELGELIRFSEFVGGLMRDPPVQPIEYNGPRRFSAASFDLGGAGRGGLYRHLVHLRGVLPGRTRADVSIAGVVAEVPTAAWMRRLDDNQLARRLRKLEGA